MFHDHNNIQQKYVSIFILFHAKICCMLIANTVILENVICVVFLVFFF